MKRKLLFVVGTSCTTTSTRCYHLSLSLLIITQTKPSCCCYNAAVLTTYTIRQQQRFQSTQFLKRNHYLYRNSNIVFFSSSSSFHSSSKTTTRISTDSQLLTDQQQQQQQQQQPKEPQQEEEQLLPNVLAGSKYGLDPYKNRFHAPIVYHENYSFDNWPENYTFPMNKFYYTAQSLLNDCQKVRPTSLLPRPLVRNVDDFFRPYDYNDDTLPIVQQWLCGPIQKEFVHRFINQQLTIEECRIIGFREQTSRSELIERTILEVAGTVLACQLACYYGISSNVAGGTHHAHSTMGAGYTILNDLAVAAYVLTQSSSSNSNSNNSDDNRNTNIGTTSSSSLRTDDNNKNNNGSIDINGRIIERVLVIDCDVHQGDGTAKFGHISLLKDKLYTLSLHCTSNYPHPKAYSTYDIGLPDNIHDDDYMILLKESVQHAIQTIRPQFILYDAGVDVYEYDTLGRCKLTENGIRQRDRYVLDTCVSNKIPVAAVLGGGYDKDIHALARRHSIIHEECAYIWRKYKMWEKKEKIG